MNRKSGFTLIEILIAAALLSGLVSAAFFSFSTLQRTMSSGRETYDFFRKTTILSRRLDLLISQASPYKQRAKDRHFDGTADSLSFTTLRGDGIYGPPRYVTLEQRSDGVYLETNELSWLVDKPPTATKKEVKLEQVKSLEISYSEGKVDSWKDSWDALKKKALPKLVKLQLEMTNDKGLVVPLTVMVRTRLDRDPSIP